MKRAFSILLSVFLTKLTFGQTQSIVGAWFWSDSTKQINMFFKQDGSILMHTGPKGGEILTENFKNGTYLVTTKLLTFKWADNKVEKRKIKFIDYHSFVLTIVANGKKINQIFRRIIDEEVVEEK